MNRDRAMNPNDDLSPGREALTNLDPDFARVVEILAAEYGLSTEGLKRKCGVC